MAVSVAVLATVVALHLLGFVGAVGAERRRSTATVVSDEYDEKSYCSYTTDASTVCGLSAFGLLILSQALLNGVARCLCYGPASSREPPSPVVFFFIFLLGVFAAGAAMTLLSLLGSVFFYWLHSRADTGGWQKHCGEGVGMAASDFAAQQASAGLTLGRPELRFYCMFRLRPGGARKSLSGLC